MKTIEIEVSVLQELVDASLGLAALAIMTRNRRDHDGHHNLVVDADKRIDRAREARAEVQSIIDANSETV